MMQSSSFLTRLYVFHLVMVRKLGGARAQNAGVGCQTRVLAGMTHPVLALNMLASSYFLMVSSCNAALK